MKHFHCLGHLAAHFAEIALHQREMEHHALEKVGKLVEKRAKVKIGEYQDEAGPFAEWAQLADSTLYGGFSAEGHRYPGKIELGYATEGDHKPLLRTGAMRDSIGHTVHGSEVQIGSNSDVAVDQELGTRYIPARSFLGGAAVESMEKIKEIIGDEAVASLVTDEFLGGRMRIDTDV